MKKITEVLILLGFLIMLTGCSGDEDTTNMSQSTPESGVSESDTPTASKADSETQHVKTEEELILDLNSSREFFSWFDPSADEDSFSPGSDFFVTDLEITKRKSDEELDDVYVTVSATNGYANYTGAYNLCYSLYDVGGWCLDDVFLEGEQRYWPVNTPDMSDALVDCPHIFSEDQCLKINQAVADDMTFLMNMSMTPMETPMPIFLRLSTKRITSIIEQLKLPESSICSRWMVGIMNLLLRSRKLQ